MKKNLIITGVSVLAMVSLLAQAQDTAAPAAKKATPAPKTAAAAPAAPVAATAKVKKALDKADALSMMNMQYTVGLSEIRLVNIVQRRNDMIEVLRLKYLKEDERNSFLFDVGALKFFPKADIEKAQASAAATKTEFKMPEGIKIIDVSKDDSLAFANMAFAIESARNELNQIYTRRNDLVKSLLEKYTLRADDTDIDVINGNFIEKAKVEEAKADK